MKYAADNEKERGWILRILDRLYPDPIDVDTIKKQLVELKFMTSELDLRGNVAYLEGKGLIVSKEVGFGSIKRTVITLTPDGKDLVDGVKPSITGVDV